MTVSKLNLPSTMETMDKADRTIGEYIEPRYTKGEPLKRRIREQAKHK